MAGNISYGTYVTDGLRSGPLYSGPVPQTAVPFNRSLNLTYSTYQQYGPGVLYSPVYTWNITPAATSVTFDNIVAQNADGAVPVATNLQLRGDNVCTRYFGGYSPYVQLDWPRVVTVRITGAIATPGTRVTIYGYDWYNNPVQQTYVVSAITNYPAVDVSADGVLSLSTPAKAFYTITGVHVDSGLPAGCLLSVGASDIFGLPYVVNDFGDVLGIGWDDKSELTCNAAPVYTQGAPIAPSGLFVPADRFPADATGGDVRGLYSPSTSSDGAKNLLFTYYVSGADQWVNQVANAQLNDTLNNIPVTGSVVRPLAPEDLYGHPQFYTGTPS